MKHNIFQIILLAIFIMFGLSSCRKDETNPITWNYWTDDMNTKLLHFNTHGRVYDLFDFTHTWKDHYFVGEKKFSIYHRTTDFQDTLKGEILFVDETRLVLKYENGQIDSLHRADRSERIIGNWVPNLSEVNLDSFEIRRNGFDCIKRDTSGHPQYFRYKLLNDTVLVFDYFEEKRKDTLSYQISDDNVLLMLMKGEYGVSLKRK